MTNQQKAEKLFYESLDHIKSKKFRIALDLLISADQLTPNRKSILTNLCTIFIELGELDKSKKYLDKLLLLFKNDIDVRLIEIDYNIKQGNLNVAKLKIESLETNEDSYDKLIRELEIYQKFYDYEKVLRIYEKLIAQKDFDIEYLRSLIFMNLYSNPISNKNFNLLISKFKNEVRKSHKIELEKVNKKFNNNLNLGFIVNRYPSDPAFQQIKGVLKELKQYPVILQVFLDNTKNEINNFEELNTIFHHVYDINRLTVKDSSKLIAAQNIDFLFDLAGYSAGNRLEILMYKPARKIISWAGFLCDTQIEEIDYIIIDKFCNERNIETIQENKKLFVNNIWAPYNFPKNEISEIRPKKKYKDTFNFGSFANPFKYNNEVIKTWSEILKSSENTKLIINYFHLGFADSAEKLYDRFYKFGISQERLIIGGLKKMKEVFADYNEIDLVLDTFPYNGMTTNFHSILMDVPFLTLKGKQFLSNCGYSINKNLNLEFLICENTKEYIRKAVFLSKNPIELTKLKNKIQLEKFRSNLFEYKNFTKNLIDQMNSIRDLYSC